MSSMSRTTPSKLTASMRKQQEARRTAKLLRRVNGGSMTINEARERLGLRPYPDDGVITQNTQEADNGDAA